MQIYANVNFPYFLSLHWARVNLNKIQNIPGPALLDPRGIVRGYFGV